MSQFVKLTNRQIDKSATFSSFHCKIDKSIKDIERIYHQYRKNTDIQKKHYYQIINQNSKTLRILQSSPIISSTNRQIDKSTNWQIGKLANRLISKLANRQINKLANWQIGKSPHQQIGKSAN